MGKELKLSELKTNTTDYIVVGDTIGDNTITEIWCSSNGKVMFTISSKSKSVSNGTFDWYAQFEELINLIKIEEANKEEVKQNG
tara:strand:- start:733 stop:984 length:252 start_codon:yes stop_codon:yes gene_type:complete